MERDLDRALADAGPKVDRDRSPWRALNLTRGSPIPLYYQLAEAIRARIASGELRPGDQLPAERELADQSGISRMTARQAVTYLVRDGTLEVRVGIGTFVAEPKLTYDALHLLGFTEETMRHGAVVSSRVLEQIIVTPPAPVQAGLKLGAGEDAIKIVRVRFVSDTPVLLETSFLPNRLCPGLLEEDLERHSLYSLLELRYGLRLHHARQTIEATQANAYESELFSLPEGAPMLLAEGVTYGEGDQPVEYFKAVYRADRVKLEIESRREPSGRLDATAPLMSLVVK